MGFSEALQYFMVGVLLGSAAGVSPGPLLALVISETLVHTKKEGILVSIAPALTDLPVIAVTVYILSGISDSSFFLGILSLAGAFFIGHLAYRNIMIRDINLSVHYDKPQSLRKGVITNFLSPHPYLFWTTIGAPTVMKAWQIGIPPAVSFIAGFYLLLIGSKILIALVVSKSKDFLQSRTYVYIIRTMGVILLFFAVLFLKEGLSMLGLF